MYVCYVTVKLYIVDIYKCIYIPEYSIDSRNVSIIGLDGRVANVTKFLLFVNRLKLNDCLLDLNPDTATDVKKTKITKQTTADINRLLSMFLRILEYNEALEIM